MNARARLRLERSLYDFTRAAWPHFETVEYRDNWHIEVICSELERFARGDLQRFLLNQPPSTSKTTLTSITLPAWIWTMLPDRRFIYLSYGEKPLTEATSKLHRLLLSPWYRERWGDRLTRGASLTFFHTPQGGFRLNTTPEGQGTGLHGHYLLIDDAIKPGETIGGYGITGSALSGTWDRICNTFRSRSIEATNFPTMIQGQRLHPDDPTGKALEEGGWEHLSLPMRCELETKHALDPRTEEGESLDPVRFPLAWCEAEEKRDPATWQTQDQQRPYVPGGSIIQEVWLDEHEITLSDFAAIVGRSILSVDATFTKSETSDMVSIQHWKIDFKGGKKHFYGRPLFFERATFLDTLRALERLRPLVSEIWIEAAANGHAIENVLSETFRGVCKLVPTGGRSKAARLQATTTEVSNGQVHLVRDANYDRIKTALVRFPRVRFDDEVDAFSQAINYGRGGSLLAAAADVLRSST